MNKSLLITTWVLTVPLLVTLTACGNRGSAPDLASNSISVNKTLPTPLTTSSITLPEPKQEATQSLGIVPTHIEIPKVGVNAPIDPAGLMKNGQMDVPANDTRVGWYHLGTKPGDIGNAVLDGHVDNQTGPAVFFYLKDLKPGDPVWLSDANGKKLEFIVDTIAVYPEGNAPVEKVFGNFGRRNLNLITCTGVFNHSEKSYESRLVVFTHLSGY